MKKWGSDGGGLLECSAEELYFYSKALETNKGFVARELHVPNSLGKCRLEDLCVKWFKRGSQRNL